MNKPKLVNSQTTIIYRYGAIYEENHFILMNPTSNFKIVAIKKDRYCEECAKLIKAKSRCYRCRKCIEVQSDIPINISLYKKLLLYPLSLSAYSVTSVPTRVILSKESNNSNHRG